MPNMTSFNFSPTVWVFGPNAKITKQQARGRPRRRPIVALVQFAGWAWQTPIHVAASERTPGVGTGFLTPTPVKYADSVWVLGSPRDERGRGHICAMEIVLGPKGTVSTESEAALLLPPGEPGNFDENGAILGDVINVPDRGVSIAYVGFADSVGQKFAARTGVACVELDDGIVQRPVGATRIHPVEEMPLIEALHAVRVTDDGFDVLYCVGNPWEFIDGAPFPSYDVYRASGSDLENLRGNTNPLLPRPHGVYRLGRPRWFPQEDGQDVIVATGGRRDGDYRPYVFREHSSGGFVLVENAFPFLPGDFPWCKIQLSYPCVAVVDDDTALMVMNGDRMGEAGFFASVGRR